MLSGFYIGTMSIVLIFMAFIVGFCELTKLFKDGFNMAIMRTVLALSLLVLSYYMQYLGELPQSLLSCLFIVVLFSSFFFCKVILHEYLKRKRKYNELKGVRNANKTR